MDRPSQPTTRLSQDSTGNPFWRGRVVVVTGGSSGIGLALTEALVAVGADVTLTGRRGDLLKEIADRLSRQGPGRALPLVSDVTDESAPSTLSDHLATYTGGRLDVLIHNAGISMRGLFAETDPAVLERLMAVNFFGPMKLTRALLPSLLAYRGSLVAISSIAGYRGLPGRTGYSASKAALQAFMEALRTELIGTGVHCLVVCPGFTASGIREAALSPSGSPVGESPMDEASLMPAAEVARLILDAIRARRERDLILTRQGKLTVWLNKLMPRWMDGMVRRHFEREQMLK